MTATHGKKSGRDANKLTNPLPGRPALFMDKNPLLVRATVGQTKPTVYDLPGNDHVYGKLIDRNPLENAANVVHHWTVKATSKECVPALDYVTMNRNSIKKGVITPKEMREYRLAFPVRVKVGEHALYAGRVGKLELGLERRRGPLPSDKNPYYTYGKPTRPSTPVGKLMTDQYQREWLQMIAKQQQEKQKQDLERSRKKHHHKNAVIHQPLVKKHETVLEKDVKTLFKMSKFKAVKAKISTHKPLPEIEATAPVSAHPKNVKFAC